jgi:hypothetical protein
MTPKRADIMQASGCEARLESLDAESVDGTARGPAKWDLELVEPRMKKPAGHIFQARSTGFNDDSS